MFDRLKLMGIISCIGAFILLLMMFNHIRQTYLELNAIKHELSQVTTAFKQYQSLVEQVNNIDRKFTQELTDAKIENNKLYHNVIDGIGRLQLNIKQTGKQASTASLDDGSACELTGEARQNYYLLRDDILTKDAMILGLQTYIKQVCLTP